MEQDSSVSSFPRAEQAFAFFTPDEARTIEAAMARIFPDDDLGAGAVQAGAVIYIDRALAGAERELQGLYRAGIHWLDALASERFQAAFRDCAASDQDHLLRDMETGAALELATAPSGPVFFELLRAHTLEGVFADPVHGGNQNLVGWKLLGYPGPQPSYSHEEQQLNAVITRDRIFTAADYPLSEKGDPR